MGNQATFMDGAVHDLTLNIGLYGQIVMTLPSVQTVVVGFGRDLRPIEPARIGYYPGVCKALGLPCNKPEPIPKTKCGERLQCTGVSAQCFSGGNWSHKEPFPGKQQCVDCFRSRLPAYEHKFPEAKYMIQNCPKDEQKDFEFIRCFCGLTGINANPFAPWPSTTTTTPMPSLPTWSKHMGKNCYRGHGATNIDTFPVGKRTLADCEKSCDESAACTGITIKWSLNGEPTNCWRRSNINIAACDSGDGYDTWTKTPASMDIASMHKAGEQEILVV